MGRIKKLAIWMLGSKDKEATSRCKQFQLDSTTLRINASAFCKSYGVQVEPSTEGGLNVASLDQGDWLSWDFNVRKEETYLMKYRVASIDGHGAFELSTSLGTFAIKEHVPHTDGWQTWATIVQEVTIPAGKRPITLKVTQGGFNLKWVEFTKKVNVNTIAAPSGFVRADNKQIVGPDGKPLLLRGIGLGGHMVQEPYLMLQERSARAQWQMFEQITDLIGDANFKTYHQAWLDNYFTLDDVKETKKAGFNSIRIPIHYNLFTLSIEDEPVAGTDTWLESGFTRLDQLVKRIASEGMFSIIDLHAPPGELGSIQTSATMIAQSPVSGKATKMSAKRSLCGNKLQRDMPTNLQLLVMICSMNQTGAFTTHLRLWKKMPFYRMGVSRAPIFL